MVNHFFDLTAAASANLAISAVHEVPENAISIQNAISGGRRRFDHFAWSY
jgi:hypothetical protein